MSYRPYPNRERALAQVHRHTPSVSMSVEVDLRPLGEAFARLREGAQRMASDTGTYVLSTRRRVVSGGS